VNFPLRGFDAVREEGGNDFTGPHISPFSKVMFVSGIHPDFWARIETIKPKRRGVICFCSSKTEARRYIGINASNPEKEE
jgi:hypothetical protein